jgi:cysteinyl-tRNA synthetase
MTEKPEHLWCGIPHRLAAEVTKYTNMPWWNAEAYDAYCGLSTKLRSYFHRTGDTIDDLIEVMEWLRSEKQFDKADRLRTIIGRLARLRPDEPRGNAD